MTVDLGMPQWAVRQRKPRAAIDPDTPHGMPCPFCAGDSGVIDSRPRNQTVWRRRVCTTCKRRFTTFEVATDTDPTGFAGDTAKAMKKQVTELRALADLIERMANGLSEPAE